MKTFISNILPRLKDFSKTLDHKEILIDQPWVLVDGKMNKHQYIFQRNGSLILSLNGNVVRGAWEYISSAQSLLIEAGAEKILLKHGFVDPAVLVLKKDGFIDEPWIVVNERIVPDLNVERYLTNLLDPPKTVTTETKMTVFTAAKLNDEYSIYVDTGELFDFHTVNGNYFNEPGTKVSCGGNPVPDRVYKADRINLYLIVRDSIVVESYSTDTLHTDRGVVTIQRDTGKSVKVGDKVIEGSNTAYGRYKVRTGKLTYNKSKVNYIEAQNGVLTKVVFKWKLWRTALVVLLVVLGLLLFVIM